jgi:hypothetical protein
MSEQPTGAFDDVPQPTGSAGVDAVLESLAALDDTPVSEHVPVFESAHEQLRRALDARPES